MHWSTSAIRRTASSAVDVAKEDNGTAGLPQLRPVGDAPTSIRRPGGASIVRRLFDRQTHGRRIDKREVVSSTFVEERMELNKRVLGHLAQTFCVVFDRSGQFVFTGSDDFLVKAWSIDRCALRYTYRGCSTQITDMDVSQDNRLIAASSFDKHIRIWSIHDGRQVACVPAHGSMTCSVQFLPFVHDADTSAAPAPPAIDFSAVCPPSTSSADPPAPIAESPECQSDVRYIVSTGNDGVVIFTTFNERTQNFGAMGERQTRFEERESVAQMRMLQYVHSHGGRFVVVGGSDGRIIIYGIDEFDGPKKQFDRVVHSDNVDSLTWSSPFCTSLTFASASRDGTANVWTLKDGQWVAVTIDVSIVGKRLALTTCLNQGQLPPVARKDEPLHIGMIAFAHDDRWLCASLTDNNIYTFCASSGRVLRVLCGLKDISRVLNTHPINDCLLLCSSDDGNVTVWDVRSGRSVFRHFNLVVGEGHANAFDAQFSPDGQSIVAVDSHGCLLVYSTISRSSTHQHLTPDEQFFHTDFRPVKRDMQGYVLDEQTSVAPHAMPPPKLVDMYGAPLDDQWQTLVPGREPIDVDEAPIVRRAATTNNATPASGAITQALMHHIEVNNLDVDGVRVSNDHFATAAQAPAVCASTSAPTDDRQRKNAVELNVSVWAMPGRYIVRPLTDDQIAAEKMRRRNIGHHESHEFAVNSVPRASAASNAATVESHNVALVRQKTRSRRRPLAEREAEYARNLNNNSRPSQEEAQQSRRQRAVRRRNILDGDSTGAEESRDGVEEMEIIQPGVGAQNTDSNASSSAGGGSSSEDDDSSDTDYEERTERRPARTQRRRVVREEEDDVEEMDDGEEASTSYPVASPAARPSKARVTVAIRADRAPRPLPEWKNSFPDWMATSEPTRFPYFPQRLDEIVIVKQGYVDYLTRIEAQKIFKVKPTEWPSADFREEEFARVDEVEYVLKPYRCAMLHLSQLHHTNKRPTGVKFHLFYTDLANQADFLLLRQHYERSVAHNYKKGDRIQAVIDAQWWFGVVEGNSNLAPTPSRQQARSTDRRHYVSLEVRWGTEALTEPISPWDVQPWDSITFPAPSRNQLPSMCPATQNQLYDLAAYEESEGEFGATREATTDRMLAAIADVTNDGRYDGFKEEVPLTTYPQYSSMIAYPVDLDTIKMRLENGFYRRLAAVRHDVEFLLVNALQFNEDDSDVAQMARELAETLIRYMEDDSLTEGCAEMLADMQEMGDEEMVNCANVVREHERLANVDIVRYHGVTYNPQPPIVQPGASSVKVDDTEWRRECSHILEEVCLQPYAKNFVDDRDTEHPEIFTEPDILSLGDMIKKLTRHSRDSYCAPSDVRDDVRRLIQHAQEVATDRRSTLHMTAMRLSNKLISNLNTVEEQYEWRRNNPTPAPTPDDGAHSLAGRRLRPPPRFEADDADDDEGVPMYNQRRRHKRPRRLVGITRPQRHLARTYYGELPDDGEEETHDRRRQRRHVKRQATVEVDDEPTKRRRVARVYSDEEEEERSTALQPANGQRATRSSRAQSHASAASSGAKYNLRQSATPVLEEDDGQDEDEEEQEEDGSESSSSSVQVISPPSSSVRTLRRSTTGVRYNNSESDDEEEETVATISRYGRVRRRVVQD